MDYFFGTPSSHLTVFPPSLCTNKICLIKCVHILEFEKVKKNECSKVFKNVVLDLEDSPS